MSTTMELKDALTRNLQLFNAKERDHLMRFAYLGQNTPYTQDSAYMHPDFDQALRGVGSLGDSAKCIFAGMDFHLDWLFAALWLAVHEPHWQPASGVHPALPVEANPATSSDADPAYCDFRPIMGNQEDIDFLALYADGAKLTLLLVEAKGSAAFDRVQLARKLIRLDRIIDASGLREGSGNVLQYRLVLASPNRPKFSDRDGKPMSEPLDCTKYAAQLPLAPPRINPDSPEPVDKFLAMRTAIAACRTGIGDGLHHLELRGFPQKLLVLKQDGTMKKRATPHAARGKGKS
jgi:hypothetical protein